MVQNENPKFSMGTDWDRRFLDLAAHVAQWSKDPSTQVGAVIVRPNRSIASVGFNGLPIGVEDLPERLNDRELKYRMIVHAEGNAMDFAAESLQGYTLYTWPFPPCSVCAGHVIQRGIKRVVAQYPTVEIWDRWEKEIDLACLMFYEASVEVMMLPYEDTSS